jgi:hypothetical protein
VQVITPTTGEAFLKLRLKDQAGSLQLLDDDPNLKGGGWAVFPKLSEVLCRFWQHVGRTGWVSHIFIQLTAAVGRRPQP